MKRAIIVVGPESSGTRFLTRLLIRSGFIGEDTHSQAFDERIPENLNRIVWRRSVPHGRDAEGKFPNLSGMIELLRRKGYSVEVLVLFRDFKAVIASQVKEEFVPHPKQALSSIRLAYQHIFSQLANSRVNWIPISYDALVTRGLSALDYLERELDIKLNSNVLIKNGNNKYYK